MNATSKLVKAWESKNAKNAAKAGGISLMALSLAACGGSSSTPDSGNGSGSGSGNAPDASKVVAISSTVFSPEAGGSGADSFNAGISAGTQQLTSLHTINGAGGTDTLTVQLNGDVTPTLTSVENVVASASTNNAELNLSGATGVAAVTNSGSSTLLTVSNISGAVDLTLKSTDQGGTFSFDTAGSKAAQTVNVSGVTGGTLTVSTSGALTLNSIGSANTIAVSSSATSLSLTGSKDITLSGNTAASTISAANLTGGLTVTSDNTKAVSITGGAGGDTVTLTGTNALTDTISLGAGNDKVTFGGNLADADVVDGGDGVDTVVGVSAELIGLTTTATTSNLTNFEVVQVSDQLDGNIDFSDDVQEDGLTTITLATTGEDLVDGTGRTITGEAGSLTVNLGASAAGNSGSIGSAGTLTFNDGATNTATTDALTINNTAVNTTTGKNLDLDDSITSTGYEVVTFNTGSGSGNTEQTIPTVTITADAATAATSLTLTGTNAIDIDSVSTNSTASLTITGSGLTAQAANTTTMEVDSVTAGTGATVSITGSAGEDIFGDSAAAVSATLATTINAGAGDDVIFTGSANDTVNGGAGDDTIDAGTGNDTIDGGAGDDTIDMQGVFTKDDTVVGGDGTDTLLLNNTDATTLNALTVAQVNTMNAKNGGVEKVTFANGLAQSLDVTRIDEVSTIQLGTLGTSAALTGLAATNSIVFTATTGNALTLGLATATGTSDVLNLNMDSDAGLNVNTITANSIERINITSDRASSSAADTADQNTMALVSDTAKEIFVTGKDGLSLTSSSATAVTLFDASGVVAEDTNDTAANMAVVFTSANASGSAVVTIKGGAGNDVLQGRAGSDVITGGAGTDQITYTGGNDTLSGDAGVDTFVITAALFEANSTSSNTTTFDGGAGTDIVSVTNASVTLVDADFDGMTLIETLTLGNFTNSVTLGAKADAMGLTTINGGTVADTIVLTDSDFNNAIDLVTGTGSDVITLGTQAATYVTDTLTHGSDQLTGWTTGTDQIDLDISVLGISGTAGDNLANGNYYEGAVASLVAGTAYDVIVLTGASYANVNAAEDAIAGVSTSATDALVIFHDSTDGEVRMFHDADIGADNILADNALLEFTEITTLASVAGSFAIGDFNIIA